MGADEAAAIGDQAIHRVADGGMLVAAGIDAIILSEAGEIIQVWYIRTHQGQNYTPCKV